MIVAICQRIAICQKTRKLEDKNRTSLRFSAGKMAQNGEPNDSGLHKMYFFTRFRKKSGKGKNFDRQIPGGVWKKTGRIDNIKFGNSVATKTSFTYYKKNQTEEKTAWEMKEYKLVESEESTPWSLCVVYPRRTARKTK